MNCIGKNQKHIKSSKLSVVTNQEMKNTDSSLFSLLQYFDLSQYYEQLKSKGFSDSNSHLQLLNIKNRRKFTNELNLMPGHNNRFLRMFCKLEKMVPREGLFQNRDLHTDRGSENMDFNSRQVSLLTFVI